ncbi:hypothetical protein SADUNF_Sadunf06G0209500 [Salix dunnii]|uniref:Uncharacterized protein n=1 Tax=Salix dunnii TaxID=1413687 RepID=A0A835K5X3_9ROSI|nr:hypothetical protein SADUNF_Sadunf06G0209500 [Salix dunnii]
MGVLVANPQDCLKNPLQSQPQRMRFPRNPNPNHHRQNRSQPNRRKRSPNSSPPPRDAFPKNNNVLVAGQVKILKRGEEDSVKPSKVEAPKGSPIPKAVRNRNLVLGSTACLGPDPLLFPSRVRLTESNGFDAGSAFFTSPPPSNGNLALGSTASLGPDPLLVPSRVRLTESNGFYAGSAFFTSPPPSSLPLPGFFRKKTNDPVVVDAGRHVFKNIWGRRIHLIEGIWNVACKEELELDFLPWVWIHLIEGIWNVACKEELELDFLPWVCLLAFGGQVSSPVPLLDTK